MNWEEIRKKYPRQWLLVEATVAHSERQLRILDELEVLDIFDNSTSALGRYKIEHHTNRFRELFVLHTSRKNLEIEERRWIGPRV